ncbi:hypothetical protein SAY87_031659 [Trapa incisa]|uniref:Uncharacterized protein n=1 Tax=Trapa incisa TaxID=236973 RepID=A0AAN7KY47_9MYRT|nr:hypothetical protein SAY87_031659 [Trapa incisa]
MSERIWTFADDKSSNMSSQSACNVEPTEALELSPIAANEKCIEVVGVITSAPMKAEGHLMIQKQSLPLMKGNTTMMYPLQKQHCWAFHIIIAAKSRSAGSSSYATENRSAEQQHTLHQQRIQNQPEVKVIQGSLVPLHYSPQNGWTNLFGPRKNFKRGHCIHVSPTQTH